MDALLSKLQYRGGVVVVRDLPEELESVVADWQGDGVDVSFELLPDTTFAVVFVRERKRIAATAQGVIATLAGDDPILWFAYPKKSAPDYSSDISRDDSWQAVVDLGFRGVRQVAIDENWSALRFRRVPDPGA